MSGFVGQVHLTSCLDQIDPALISSMAQTLVHRGPDFSHTFQSSHCTLAVKGFGPKPGAGLEHASGLALAFDGKLYNASALRTELLSLGHHFCSTADEEVVQNAYLAWGNTCWIRLEGMFAAALWDPGQQAIILARDRLGKKPLVYAILPDKTLIFASEIKALLAHPDLTPRLNPVALDRLFDFGFNLAPSTFLDNVQQIMPGTFFKFGQKGSSSSSYWTLDFNRPVLNISADEAAIEFGRLLTAAVQSRSMADGPVATYLSGGIDSSSVTALYARLADHPVQSLSITFEDADYDERHFARLVAAHCGTVHHEFLCSITPEEVTDLIWHLETPLVTLLNLPLYLLSKQVRSMGFSVVLSGDGADELLGGYNYFKLVKLMHFIGRREGLGRAHLLRHMYPNLTPAQAWMQYLRLKAYPQLHPALPYRFQAFQLKGELLSDAFLEQLVPRLDERGTDIPTIPGSRPLLDQALHLETLLRLPNLTLPLADTMSMANSVELRSPFLDQHVVDFLFRVPPQYKMRGLCEKYLLKRTARTFLPPEIWQRRKQPLAPPGQWFVKKFRPMIGDLLSAKTTRAKGYFRPEYLDQMLRAFDAGSPVDYSGVLIVVFFIHLWDDLFLSRARPGC